MYACVYVCRYVYIVAQSCLSNQGVPHGSSRVCMVTFTGHRHCHGSRVTVMGHGSLSGVTSHGHVSRVTCHGSRITVSGHESQVKGLTITARCHAVMVTSHESRVTSHESRVTYHCHCQVHVDTVWQFDLLKSSKSGD